MAKTYNKLVKTLVGIAVAFAFVPGVALASNETMGAATTGEGGLTANVEPAGDDTDAVAAAAAKMAQAVQDAEAARAQEEKKHDYTIAYDRSLIDAIGTQEQTGHDICCPSFSCAYADAVLDGTLHDHAYYTCSCCTWTDWGGGGSFDRCVGSDEQLLREAYDQIASGRPTVIHVSAGTGEHWIALIGYQNVDDPDCLTLANFVALDPWDGVQIVASDRYVLYGDGCEHISER